MSYVVQIDNFAEKLSSDASYQSKHAVLAELCDIVESFSGSREYAYFLEKLIPVFTTLLNDVSVSFISSSPENKIRNSILETLHRLVLNDTFKPYSIDVLDIIVRTLKYENEDNGVLCIKIITSIHKSYKNDLVNKVQEFINIIYEIYSNSSDMVHKYFNDQSESAAAAAAAANNQSDNNTSGGDSTHIASTNTENVSNASTTTLAELGESDDLHSISSGEELLSKRELLHTMHSFKTLSECPITMVSILSSYKQLVNKVLVDFIPKIISLLQLEVDSQRQERQQAEANGKLYTSVSPKIKNRTLYGEFIVSQVKATSFLAYIFIRDYSPDFFAKYHQIIPDLITRLLQDCPSELSAAKKELLHATRHILSTPYKTIFLPKLDLLFNEKILLGDGLTSRETLRPLAYSTIADFIHNIRTELTPQQLWKAVLMFCRILQDSSLAVNVSLMCAKLLLNLLERVTKLPTSESRKLYMIIIEAFCKRFTSLNHKFEFFLKQHKEFEKKREELEAKQALFNQANNSKLPPNPLLEEEVTILDDEDDLNIEAIIAKECKKSNNDEQEVNASQQQDVEMKDVDQVEKTEGHEDDKSNIDNLSIHNLELAYPIQISKPPANDPLKDIKYLVRNLMNYLKPVVVHLRYTNPPSPSEDYNKQVWESVARDFSLEELNIFKDLFRESILCIRFFQADKVSQNANKANEKLTFDIRSPNIPITATKEEKELMESLSIIYMKIDPSIFNEIMQSQFAFLVEQMNSNPALLHIPHFFLSNETISGNFMGILIDYLKQRLDKLGNLDSISAHIMLRLFKLFLLSLNLYPSQNEGVLLPHLNDLILKSLQLSTRAKEPLIYFYFIRILFKSIGGGRFEKLYKEVMPLMQKLLESLNKLIESARTPQERDICIELCLSIPVRLSKLVSMLHYLMRPLVLALNGSQDLVTQGLRTLELCVDNLNANYFDPIIQPVIDDVMKALWKHLKPLPYFYLHSHTAVRILGKLGGRNRSFIKPPTDLEAESVLNQKVEAHFNIKGLPNGSLLSVSSGINAAISILEDPRLNSSMKLTVHYRVNAFKYLSSVLQLMIDAQDVPENYQLLIESATEMLLKEEQLDDIPIANETIKDSRKFSNEEQLAERLLKAIFFSAGIAEVKDEVNELIINLCNHFTQLYIGRSLIRKIKHSRNFAVHHGEGKVYFDAGILFNVITYALSSLFPEVREAAINSIKKISETCLIIFGSKEASLKFGLYSSLVAIFFHSCYDELYYNKLGGVMGLNVMVNDLDIPVEWFAKYQHELVRALFFVLRDTPNIIPALVVDMSKELIIKIVQGCNSKAKSFEELPADMVSSLVYDLASSNPLVRKTSQEALHILSEITRVSKIDLISPCKTVLLNPIFAKPLRALPFPMQIGHIEAITYWLGLPHKEAEFNDEMQRLLLEVVSLVEAEDSMLTSSDRLIDFDTREQLTELRVVCIKLLTIALSKPEYTMTQPGLTRLRILAIFFKTLAASEKAIVDASHDGLRSALAQNSKLPRELLQNGLRPMLMNLSDYRKLTVSNLETLARLLVVLVNYFKVEIGKKLLDHLNSWAMPALLHQIAGYDLSNNKVMQIINAIFNIFHLLPAKAHVFIPEVLNTLAKIESNLRRVDSSSSRPPVAKFINKYANEASEYFAGQFLSRKMQSLHAYFVEECPKLKEATKANIGKFLNLLINEQNFYDKVIKFSNFVDLAMAISSDSDQWFKEQGDVLIKLFDVSKDIVEKYSQDPYNQAYHFQLLHSMDKLQKLIVKFFNVSRDDTLLISLIDALNVYNVPNTTTLDDFIMDSIVKSGDVTQRQSYLARCIELVTENQYSVQTKVYILKQIFNPILLFEQLSKGSIKSLFETGDEDKAAPEWLTLLHTRIWKSTSDTITNRTAGEVDSYRFELLQLTSILLKYNPGSLESLRKDVIKFSWNFMKLDDTLTKYAAYMVTCYFIHAYDTHVKITTHMFFALLRANNIDSRYIVKLSLDLLAEVMPTRMSKSDEDGSWSKWPRRVISENGFLINNIFNVYRFIVQHGDLFFDARDHFIPNAITAMGKLTLLPNLSVDNQTLAIELSELILSWEKRALELKSKAIKQEEGETDKQSASFSKSDSLLDYNIPFGQKEAFVTFLVRYICISTQRASSNELGRRALAVLYEILSPSYWPDVSVKLAFFEKFLINTDLSSGNISLLGYCWNALEVLGVALEHKSSEWIVGNLAALQTLLEKCIRTFNHDIQEVLQRVLRIILKAVNDETDDEAESEEIKDFINLLITVISEDLSNTSSLSAGITLFSTLAVYKPVKLNPLIPSMIKTFGKLCKDHVTIMGQKHSPENSSQVEDEAKMTSKLLSKILDFATMRIAFFGDHRRIFLSILAQFIERLYDKDLLKHIINVVYKWIFSNPSPYPTHKEKAAILLKMMGFESRREIPVALSKKYLKIIIKIFEDRSEQTADLTMRLEHAFLIGTRFVDVGIRKRFMSILDNSLPQNMKDRLYYVIKEQNWEDLADFPWLIQALELLFGAFDADYNVKLSSKEYKFAPLNYIDELVDSKSRAEQPKNEQLEQFLDNHKKFLQRANSIQAKDIINPLIEVLRNDVNSINLTWTEVFPVTYKCITESERPDFVNSFTSLLSKEYHLRQVNNKLNGIQVLLASAAKCEGLNIPPHLSKYLGTTFGAYYFAMQNLEKNVSASGIGRISGDEEAQDALLEVYSAIDDKDMFYGLWRRRAKYSLTNSALSYEQIGMCDMAMRYYEHAQIKTRTSTLPYSESEYALWEDNWISCAEKLQHWDILTELAKHENYTDLLLECGWRVANWNDDKKPLEQSVKTVIDVPTPRRQTFQTFLCLQDFAQQKKSLNDVLKLCDEGVQLSLKKWAALPTRFTNAHTSMLHVFQQYVEFTEASQIYSLLVTTNTQNIEVKLQELKRVLQAWRERLPNVWDDINVWNDLIVWRQHFFQLVNNIYIPFLQTGKANNYSQVYCGYHETACVINRFAHVSRKHGLDDVCIQQLNKIYNLPNIEIMEAFLKLIEQVKCYYQNDKELNTGLDVISNTNLAYFGTKQKAEFFVLKGMFLAKLNSQDKANHAFATAIQLDSNLAKAWAKWGLFNYSQFKQSNRNSDTNETMQHAKNALICFLHAVGLYKSAKSRRYLALILWLISLDDEKGTLAAEFQNFKGEVPVWYWITFIPQLLTSLSHKEAKFARNILILIAKSYPQALHFPLRTTKEDFLAIQKQIAQNSQLRNKASNENIADGRNENGSAQAHNNDQSSNTNTVLANGSSINGSLPNSGNNSINNNIVNSNNISNGNGGAATAPPGVNSQQSSQGSGAILEPPNINSTQTSILQQFSDHNHPWEYVEEIMNISKTAYPLLALSLESLVAQITQRFKSNADEDAYRLIAALYNDGMQSFNRMLNPKGDGKLPAHMIHNLIKFAETVLTRQVRAEFEKDFIIQKPNYETYIKKLIKWKERFENKLDRRFNKINLENLCPHLTEFHHQKFEDIEIPGQYLLNKDNNTYFVKIERFLPTLEVVRGYNACYKRLRIKGKDGSIHQFAVQFPSNRHSRREERIFQLFRIFDGAFTRNVECRSRNISLTIPIAVALSPHIRILSNDSNDVSLQEVYEQVCRERKQEIEKPFFYITNKLKATFDPRLPKPDIVSTMTEIFSAVQTLFVPSNVVHDFFAKLYPKFEDFWLFRRQFTAQYASFIFMTYMMSITSRQPQKIHINIASGTVWTSEMLPNKTSHSNNRRLVNIPMENHNEDHCIPIFHNPEAVPFRLTPNIQKLIGDTGLEGVLSVYVLVIARCLVSPEFEIEHFLSLFVRDEVISWFAQNLQSSAQGSHLREIVRVNVDLITTKIAKIGHVSSSTPITTQYVNELIASAVNPRSLAQLDYLWRPYL